MAKVELKFGELGGSSNGKFDEFTPSTSTWHTTECDFEPNKAMVVFPYGTHAYGVLIDYTNNTAKRFYESASEQSLSLASVEAWFKIEGNTVYFKATDANYGKVWLMAVKE